MLDVIFDTLIDFVKLLPFLFITYYVMEWIEHNASSASNNLIKKSGKLGPVIGGVLGVVPQCGFSAAGSTFYAGRVISLGTLIAIYLSTSDEMLPVMIASKAPAKTIVLILVLKMIIGIISGLIIDNLIFPTKNVDKNIDIDELCTSESCGCKTQHSILKPAVMHTMKTGAFILGISFAINLIFFLVGEDALTNVFTSIPVVENMIAALVGLIPNCAASVAITTLYVEGLISFSAMLSGLLSGAGVGVLVLFRVNHHRDENIKILLMLYGFAVVMGCLTGFFMTNMLG